MPQSRVDRTARPRANWGELPPKIYGVMVMTTLLTFGSLMTAYQLFFVRSPFA